MILIVVIEARKHGSTVSYYPASPLSITLLLYILLSRYEPGGQETTALMKAPHHQKRTITVDWGIFCTVLAGCHI